MAALSSCVSAIGVYAAALIAAVGSSPKVSRSDRSTTVAISRRRSKAQGRRIKESSANFKKSFWGMCP